MVMKKYIKPIAIEVKMESAAVMAASLQGDGLDGTSSGGTTGDNGVKDADAKGGMWDLGD